MTQWVKTRDGAPFRATDAEIEAIEFRQACDGATPWLFHNDRHYSYFGAGQWWLWVDEGLRVYGLRRRAV